MNKKVKRKTMARALNFSFKGEKFSLGIQKLDRKKLYGYTSVAVQDDNGSKCGLATISDDGKYILSKGCVGYTTLNERNEYVPSTSIKMVDGDGKAIEKILSSFDLEDIDLTIGLMDDYLTLYVKSVYQLNPNGETDLSSLIKILAEHKLLYFKFNYRTDYDADDAFLLYSGEAVFMVIGQISPFEFIGLEKAVAEVVVTEEEEEDFDFGML